MRRFVSHGNAQVRRVVGEVKSGRYFDLARIRARRRKSPWNLLLPVFVIPIWLALWWVANRLVWQAHLLFYPSHAASHSLLSRSGLPLRIFIPIFLMFIPTFLPTMVWSMVISNALLWLIPPVRRIFDREAVDYPGTDYHSAQAALVVVALILSAAWLVVSMAGAALLSEVPS
jgi:hypothetical protein